MRIFIDQSDDIEYLKKMIYEAFFWNPVFDRELYNDFIEKEGIKKLWDNWGRHGDKLIIARIHNEYVGAAWYRLWQNDNQSYGFYDEMTPELGLAVQKKYRNMGNGRKLLRILIGEAIQCGFSKISLSVDPSNCAYEFYVKEGFEKVGESGTSWILLKKLK